VIWSDEAYMVLGDWAGSVWVTRTVNEEYDEACVVPKFKLSNLHLMAWSCIMKNKKGPIIILEYLVNCMGNPQVFLTIPVPVPVKTCTHGKGMGNLDG